MNKKHKATAGVRPAQNKLKSFLEIWLVRLLSLGTIFCLSFYIAYSYSNIYETEYYFLQSSKSRLGSPESYVEDPLPQTHSVLTSRTVTLTRTAPPSSSTGFKTYTRPAALPTASSSSLPKVNEDPQLGTASITSSAASSSSRIGVAAVWMAWKTLAWMKVQQEVAERQINALVNVQVRLQLLGGAREGRGGREWVLNEFNNIMKGYVVWKWCCFFRSPESSTSRFFIYLDLPAISNQHKIFPSTTQQNCKAVALITILMMKIGFDFVLSWFCKEKGKEVEIEDAPLPLQEGSLALQLQRLNNFSPIDLDDINGGNISRRSLSDFDQKLRLCGHSTPSRSSSNYPRRHTKTCALIKLPIEIRYMIYALCMEKEWNGKIPELIKALRGDKISEGGFYDEVLEFFYKGKVFILHQENDWGFRDMEACVIEKIKKIVVAPSCDMVESTSWRFENDYGGLVYFLPQCNIDDITLDFVSDSNEHAVFWDPFQGVGAVPNYALHPLRDHWWFWKLLASFNGLQKITLILTSPGMRRKLQAMNTNRDLARLENVFLTEGFTPADEAFNCLGFRLTDFSHTHDLEFFDEEVKITRTIRKLEGFGDNQVFIWELDPALIHAGLPTSLGGLYEFERLNQRICDEVSSEMAKYQVKSK